MNCLKYTTLSKFRIIDKMTCAIQALCNQLSTQGYAFNICIIHNEM